MKSIRYQNVGLYEKDLDCPTSPPMLMSYG